MTAQSGTVSGAAALRQDSPRLDPFPPPPPRPVAHHRRCSGASRVLWVHPTSSRRTSPSYPFGSRRGPPPPFGPKGGSGRRRDLPASASGGVFLLVRCLRACMGSQTTRSPAGSRDGEPADVAFRRTQAVGAPEKNVFEARYPARTYPCQRFDHALTGM